MRNSRNKPRETFERFHTSHNIKTLAEPKALRANESVRCIKNRCGLRPVNIVGSIRWRITVKTLRGVIANGAGGRALFKMTHRSYIIDCYVIFA